MTTKLTAVYLTAGASSRFGGKMKFLARIGPNNETLLELSMNQAIYAGINNFVFIASEKSLPHLKEEFGATFKGIPINYCVQQTPEHREKPFGTAHAVLTAKNAVDSSFITLNGDDLYGKNALKGVADYLRQNVNGYCLPGYAAKNAFPKEKGNRGLIMVDQDNFLEYIEEQFGVSQKDIPEKYTGEEFISMNLFGLQPDFLNYLEKQFKLFLEENKNHPTIEFLLPNVIHDFVKSKGIKKAVIPTNDIPVGLTFPEDEEVVRNKLKWQHS